MRLDLETTDQILDKLEEAIPLLVGNKHILAGNATVHYMVPGILKFDSQWTSHCMILAEYNARRDLTPFRDLG